MPEDTGFLFSSPELDGAAADTYHPPEVPSPSAEEVNFPISCASGDWLPVGNVWRRIQGASLAAVLFLGCSQSPCLRKSPLIVRANGRTERSSQTQVMALSGAYHFGQMGLDRVLPCGSLFQPLWLPDGLWAATCSHHRPSGHMSPRRRFH